MDIFILVSIILLGFFLGWIKYKSLSNQYKGDTWHIKFIEFWNDSFNFLIAGFIVYYFFKFRWPSLTTGEPLVLSDFVLLLVFSLGIFGHLCVMSNNITKGIEAILKRVLEK